MNESSVRHWCLWHWHIWHWLLSFSVLLHRASVICILFIFGQVIKGLCSLATKSSARNSKGFTPSEGVKWKWGRKNLQFSANNSLYLRNNARWLTYLRLPGYYWWLIESRTQPFSWCQNQRHWITLNGSYAVYHTKHESFRVHHEKFNEERPILSAVKM